MEKKYTVLYRIWHWMMAFSVIGLLATVLLRKTFLSYKSNALIIQEKLSELTIEIHLDAAKSIAKAIRAPMWEWHYIFGAFLGLSILLRIYMFASKQIPSPIHALLQASKEDRLKETVHQLLYLSVAFMALSGGVLYFHDALGFTDTSVHWVKEFHEILMYAVIGFVVLHLAGVFRHEIKSKEGIVSKMIHGE